MAITDPRDISGLVFWYSAQAETGYADNAAMTSWTDLSGNGNHATAGFYVSSAPRWRSASGASGGAAVQFSNDGYFTLPSGFLSGFTQAEVMVSVKAAGATTGGSLLFFTRPGSDPHFPFTDGKIYETFGTSSRVTITPTLSIASWRRYNVWSATNDWAARLDETTQSSKASNTVGFLAGQPVIGASGTGDVQKFDGFIGALVLYNRKLTTTERADLAAWMAANPSGGTAAAPTRTGSLAATLPVPTVGLSGTYAPPAVSGSLAASLPLPTVAAAGTYAPPPSGALAATLPSPTIQLAGTYVTETSVGALAAALPVPTVALAGAYVPPPGTGFLAAMLPLPTVTFAGAYTSPTPPPPRIGFGIALDSTATVTVEPPLDVDAATVPLHVITPTVPVPVLVNGRPS